MNDEAEPTHEDAVRITEPADDPDRARRRAQAIRYVGALDGTRAVAALGVVIIHSESEGGASMTTYAFTGAITGPLFMSFFIITGFVLYRGWARRHLALHSRSRRLRGARGTADGGSDGRTMQYLFRRLIRIYPLYWLAATVAMLLKHDADFSIADRIQVYLLSPFPNPDALMSTGLGIIVWTLIVDIVFYVYVTIHGAVMTRVIRAFPKASPFRVESWVLITMFTAIFASTPFVRGPVSALACLPIGMYFAVIEAEQDRLGRRLNVISTMVGAWWIWLLCFVTIGPPVVLSVADQDDYDAFIWETWTIQVLLVALSVALIQAVLWGKRSWPINRFLDSDFMARAGKLTYGMYLWHPVVLILVTQNRPDTPLVGYVLAAIVGSLLLSFVSYNLLERPLERVRFGLRKPDPTPAT